MLWIILFVLVQIQAHLTDPPQNITSTGPCTDQNHLLLAPGVLAAGGSSRACVSRFYHEGPARMLLSLQTEDGETVTSLRELPPGDGGCLDIAVPQKPNMKANLNVNLRYPEANCVWSGHLQVRIGSSKVVVVQTERARYRPGDTIRLRVLALKADLTPAHGHVDEIWIEGPRGIWDGARAAQWLHVRTRLGLAQVQHQLDEQAPPGKWVVRARLGDGSQGTAAFSVGNYELPPFQLTVRHAPRILRTSERLVWTVCVRYPWSEAVEGMLVIRLRGAGGISESSTGIRTAVRLKAPRACHRHAAASRRIGLDGVNAPDVVVADFSFQEDGTRVWQNTTVVSQVVDDPVTLEFLTKYRAVLSPGLPYKLKVKATRWDDKPAANERVRVCRSPVTSMTSHASGNMTSHNTTCTDAVTDARGVARVLFNGEDSASPFYRFQASLNNATAELQLACRQAAHKAALGPLRADSEARALVPLYLDLDNVSTPLTVHFVVITRGGIIYRWGATTQCPTATTTTQIRSAPRNYNCHVDKTNTSFIDVKNASDVDALLEKHLLRVMLPIKVSPQMCPHSRLLAFFRYNGELVSATKHLDLEECFGNKVEANWLTRQTPPGSLASIQLSTPGPALCALSVLDTTAKTTAENIRDVLMSALKKLIDAHKNLTEHDSMGECFLSTDMPELPTSSMELMMNWFAAGGVRVSGGDAVHRRCDPAPELLVSDDIFTPRSDFSEAWLWRLVPVGPNGSAVAMARTPDSITRFEANAYCLSRTGIAISQPAVLQVFREFFIHADGPRSLRRGDRSIIRYRLFNYLYESINVQILVLTDPHMESPSSTESAYLTGRSSIARRVEVWARFPGEARVSIRASSRGACSNCSNSGVISDEVIIKIQIEQEGIPVHEHKSIMLCAKGTDYGGSPHSISWNWPSVQAVPGTESLTMWAVGDLTGPLLADADSLVTLPRGCGEQNMARLSTNLLALTQLDSKSPAYYMAKDHVARGFTRQLQYAHSSGRFSAFGPSDPMPSTWLTAFCVRYLRRAYRILSPGAPTPPALERAERWLLSQQMENGCFRNDGQVFHRELQGGLNEEGEIANVALTAYVITSLIESSASIPSRVIRNSLSCLRAFPLKSKAPSKVYAHAVLSYAFMKIKRYEEELRKTNEAALWDKKGLQEDEETRGLMELLKMAKRSGDYVWWEGTTLATSIEATGYALLVLWECPEALRGHCAVEARAAMLWLATHANPTGGFVATQDTLIALEGLTRWSFLQSPASNLTVTAKHPNFSRSITLNPGVKVPDVMHVDPADQLDVDVDGTGCALVQATRSYNMLCTECDSEGVLNVQVAVHTDGPFNCDANNTQCFCAAVVEACVVWTGQFPEMALLEISLPGGYGADAAKLYSQLNKSDLLLRRIELTRSATRATLYLGGERARGGVRGGVRGGGHGCYALHAVGPRAATRPAHVSVADYYSPDKGQHQMYTIPEDCPPRISEETNDYLPGDNLFTKAKSLTDDGEILISHEFSFEDIPDGIPLDDPMYENLTWKNKDIDQNDNNCDKSPVANQVNKSTNLDLDNGSTNDDLNATEIENDSLRQLSATNTKQDLITEKRIKLKFNKYTENEIPKDTIINDDNHKNTNIKEINEISNSQGIHVLRQNVINNEKDLEQSETVVKELVNLSTKVGQEENDSIIVNLKTSNERDSVSPETNTKRDQEEKYSTNVNLKGTQEKLEVSNPLLSDFHVIDSEKDLDVPTGLEGPLPTVVLPPQNFVYVPPDTGAHFTPNPDVSRRNFPRVPPYNEHFFYPNYNQHYRNRIQFNPFAV